MRGIDGYALTPGEASRIAGIRRCFAWRRVLAAALVTVLLSLGALASPVLTSFFSPAEMLLAWLEHLLELGVIAAALLVAYAAIDASLPHRMPGRRLAVSGLLLAVSAALAYLLHAHYAGGFEHLPPALRVWSDSLRWGLPAVFLTLVADVHQRALQADAAAEAAELDLARIEQAETEQQLALLQAQIEPHFLFNVLGVVRRLYRTRPQAGSEAIESLLRYLRTALPRLRRGQATLRDEMDSVRAYLDLLQFRMGPQLRYTLDVAPAVSEAEFPPMLVVTLVENAIKHGIEPQGGGCVEVRARRHGGRLEVSVLDDGVGFGGAPGSGTGVGLANVRRQLAARYGGSGTLELHARLPRGARATVVLPLAAPPGRTAAMTGQPR